jgi:Tol biopolymer transport system component
MRTDGSDLTQVSFDDFDKGNLAWSPDSASLFYGGSIPANDALFATNVDGSARTRLSAGQQIIDYAWSPAGDELAYIDYSLDLYRAKADGALTYVAAGDSFSSFAWSPDGKRLALSGNDGLYVIDAGATVVTATDLIAAQENPSDITWSPDSSRLVYQTGYDAHLIDIRGSNAITLPENTIVSGPGWSPDGKQLALVDNLSSPAAIVLVDAATGQETRRLAKTLPIGIVAWSPDGSSLLYTTSHPVEPERIATVYDLYISNINGSDNRVLDSFPGNITLSFSGHWALASVESGSADLVNFVDGTKVSLSQYTGDSPVDPAWSPDSRFIVYGNQELAAPGLYLLRLYLEP